MASDPLVRFQHWFRAAARTRNPLPEAAALATTSARGAPSVRFVLLKGIDARGVVFFTDTRSRKGRELIATRRAALAFYWHPGRQVRIEGRVERVSPAEADAYWATRPRPSQLAAAASQQDAPLAKRAALIARWHALARRYRGKLVPRPPAWSGFRIIPTQIEFWSRRAHRLHDREVFTRKPRGWKRGRLQP